MNYRIFIIKKSKTVEFKRKHPSYYEIQGQMYSTGSRRVDFVVWFGDEKPLLIITNHYDEQFMKTCFARLQYFYVGAILPEHFTKRVKRGLKLYLHGG